MTEVNRRQFASQTAGAAVLGFSFGSSVAGLALAQGKPPKQLRVFSELQAETYAAWCDILAIGAAKAGVAHYVDKYLAEPYAESLLLLKCLQIPPYTDFYLTGISGIDKESVDRFSKPFLSLDKSGRKSIVDAAVKSSTKVWTDPNPNFFYFISRSDAVDVVYGTVKGFRKLDIPYLPHIAPTNPW